MDKPSIAATLLGLAIATMAPIAAVRASELKVLAGGSMTASLKELGPRFEKATGHKLDITFAATPELIKMVTSGPFDLGVAAKVMSSLWPVAFSKRGPSSFRPVSYTHLRAHET